MPRRGGAEAIPWCHVASLLCRNTGERRELAPGVTTIGRRETNDIRVDHPGVSRGHCRIERSAQGWTLLDSGSTTGTFLNGHRVAEQPLKPGDEVRVGPFVFVFQAPELDRRAARRAVRGLRRLSDAAADRLVPEKVVLRGPPPWSIWRKRAPVLAGAAAIGLIVAAVTGLMLSHAQRPQQVVRQAAERVRRRDATALWELIAEPHRRHIAQGGLQQRLDAVPEGTLQALETLRIGAPRREKGQAVVPVEITVQGRVLRDSVVLCREGRRWRLCRAPAKLVAELAPRKGTPKGHLGGGLRVRSMRACQSRR